MKLTNLALCIALGATAVAAPAFAQDITLKASHNANADEPYGVGMRKMAEILEEKTDGAATIEVFDNATLGDEMESIQGTQIGTVDIAVTANSTLANFVPDLSVFSLPFLFEDAEQMAESERGASMSSVISRKVRSCSAFMPCSGSSAQARCDITSRGFCASAISSQRCTR